MADLRLRYPAARALRFHVVRTFAGGRLRPRPRSTPTTTHRRTTVQCVEPASLCLQRDNVARAPTTSLKTRTAGARLIDRQSELRAL